MAAIGTASDSTNSPFTLVHADLGLQKVLCLKNESAMTGWREMTTTEREGYEEGIAFYAELNVSSRHFIQSCIIAAQRTYQLGMEPTEIWIMICEPGSKPQEIHKDNAGPGVVLVFLMLTSGWMTQAPATGPDGKPLETYDCSELTLERAATGDMWALAGDNDHRGPEHGSEEQEERIVVFLAFGSE
jgi:hypothetical protein